MRLEPRLRRRAHVRFLSASNRPWRGAGTGDRFRAEPWGEHFPVERGQLSKASLPVLARRLEIIDTLRRQKSFDASDVLDALFHQELPFAMETPGVFLFDGRRLLADRGYRGHNAPPTHKFRVFITGQRHRVTKAIKRELKRRSAVESVIGHLKAEHRMGRNHLARATGDALNAVLAAVGHNFKRLLAWLALLRAFILSALDAARPSDQSPIAA